MAIEDVNTGQNPAITRAPPELRSASKYLNAVGGKYDPGSGFSKQAILGIAVTKEMDFIELAALSEMLVCELIECSNPVARLALLGKLSATLERLHAVLLAPVPAHRLEQLSATSLPKEEPFCIGSDALMLTNYCQHLVRVLLTGILPPVDQQGLTGLTFDLLHHLGEVLRTPSFTRTAEGYRDRGGGIVEPGI